jgi:sporulation protein YlmC with PRC-barrel domain
MKTLIWCGTTVAVVGLAAAILGQDEITSTSSSSSSYVPTSKLVGRKIKSSQGEEIGVIKDVVLDRSNGSMAYTVVSTGNAQTGGGKTVVVPWALYSPTSDASTLRVNVDRDKIYNAPLFDYARMDEYVRPDYIDNVYNYYGISPGGLNGVAASKGATAPTDVTGTAGATASPGEVASTTASGTSPANHRASTHAHATPAASQDGTATKNGSREATRSARSTGSRQPPADREEGASSTITKEFLSESNTSPSGSKKSRRKETEGTSTGRPSETPHSTGGDE